MCSSVIGPEGELETISASTLKMFLNLLPVAGAAALGYSIYRLWLEPVRADWMLTLTFLVLLASRIDVRLPGVRSKMTLTDIFIYVGVLTLNPWAATILGSIDGLATSLRNVKRVATAMINMAAMNLAVLGASLIASKLFGPIDLWSSTAGRLDHFALALAVLALVIYLINTGLIAATLAFKRNQALVKTWLDNYLWTSVAYFAGMLAAGAIAKSITVFGFYSLFLSGPVLGFTYFTYYTYLRKVERSNRRIEMLTKLHLATIESLTMAIDAKDPATRGHIQRVRVLAEGPGPRGRLPRRPDGRVEGRGAAARHRQARGARAHIEQAGQAHQAQSIRR